MRSVLLQKDENTKLKNKENTGNSVDTQVFFITLAITGFYGLSMLPKDAIFSKNVAFATVVAI